MHQPDGKPDVLQQIEHGALTVVGGYRALGRFYRGIISPTLRQYTHLGDFAAQTDGVVFDPKTAPATRRPVGTGVPGSPDDRWVFTEQNPRRELSAAAGLAASARALRGYDDALAAECLAIAKEIWDVTREDAAAAPPRATGRPSARIGLAVELLLTTRDRRYADYLVGAARHDREEHPVHGLGGGARAARSSATRRSPSAVTEAVKAYRAEVLTLEKKTPYGVPYEPDIWGAGWGIQGFGMEQYFLHTAFPEVFPKDADAPRARLRARLSTRGRTTRRSSRASARARSPSATASTARTGATSRAAASRARRSSGPTSRSCSSGRTCGSRPSTSSAAARPTTCSWCSPPTTC